MRWKKKNTSSTASGSPSPQGEGRRASSPLLFNGRDK